MVRKVLRHIIALGLVCLMVAPAWAQGQLGPYGTIRGVTAGNGLTGGAIFGVAQLDVACGTGITCNANDIVLNMTAQSCAAGSFISSASAVGVFGCTAATGLIAGLTAGYVPYASNATTIADSPMYRPSSTTLEIASNATFLFSSTTSASGSPDVGISRLSAGKLRIEDGASALRDLGVRALTASTTIDATGAITADSGLRVFDIAGAGLTSTANTIDIVAGAGITVNANDIAITDTITAGSCTSCDLTFNSRGQLTAATNGSGGGGGVSGSGTTGKIPKWASSSSLTDSIMTEASSVITFAGSQVTTGNTQTSFIGVGVTPDSNMGVKVVSSAIQYGYVAIPVYSGFSLGNAAGFAANISGTVNSTAAVRTISGLDGVVATTRSAGANDVINIAVQGNASGGQQNFAFYGVAGNFYNAGAGTFNTTLLVNGNVSAEANIQLDNVGQVEWSSTGTAGAADDTALVRLSAASVLVTDGVGTATTDYGDIYTRSGHATISFKTVDTGDFVWSSTTALGGAADTGVARGVAGQVVINDGDGIAVADQRDFLARSASLSNAGVALKMVLGGRFEWSSTTLIGGATDSAIGRNAAGVLEVNSGTAAAFRDAVARTWFGGTAAGTSFKMPSTGRFEISSTTAHTGASDTGLERSAAGNLAINDGAGVATADLRDVTARTHFGDNAGVAFKTVLGGQIQWSSTTAIGGAADVALGRNAAGRLEVNNGTAGVFADLNARDFRANQDIIVTRRFQDVGNTPSVSCVSGSPGTVTGGRWSFNYTGCSLAGGFNFTFNVAMNSTPTCQVTGQTSGLTISAVSSSAVTVSGNSANSPVYVTCIDH